jgi:cytochrome c-type biogenesis protein CcmH/NrfF
MRKSPNNVLVGRTSRSARGLQAPLLLVLILIAAPLAFAETAAEKPSVDVRRVGAHIGCQCGCTDTVATCAMLECSFSKPAKEKIARLQAGGLADKTIIDQFVAEFGPAVYRGDPSVYGWLIPYLLIAPGLALIWWFVRRYRKPRPIPEVGPAPDDAELARYRDEIEKDLAHLE